MAEFKQSPGFNTILATALDGDTVAVHIRHADSMGAATSLRLPLVKKHTYEVVDVAGAADGAGSVVRMQWNHVLTPPEKETVRILETPEQLSKIFAEAGVAMPPVRTGFRTVLRDLKKFLTERRP